MTGEALERGQEAAPGLRYGVAVAAVLLAFGLRVLLLPYVGDTLIWLTFFPALMIAGFYGGLGPGALALALSLAAAWVLMNTSTARSLPPAAPEVRTLLFFPVGALVVILVWYTRRTQRRLARAEAGLIRDREHLEVLVRDRTIELERSSAKLHASERLSSLGTLAAGLGHDVGNLLLPLRERIEALRRVSGPASKEDVDALAAGIEYLNRLSRGLRSLARDPEELPHAQRVELSQWWQDAAPILHSAVPRGVELTGDLSAGLSAAIPADALTQAVFNLVQNAGEALRGRAGGGGSVRVEARPDARPETVRLSVRDNGPGMSDEVRSRCLEPFFTTKPRGMSTGLGLSLVHGIVRRAGGEIEIDTAPGRGTAVHLLLPIARSADALPATRACVTVRDERLASFLSLILAQRSVEVTQEPDGSQVWIATAGPGVVERLLAFVMSGPGRSGVLLRAGADAPADERIVVVPGDRPLSDIHRAILSVLSRRGALRA